ncbi:MAG: hypothetical protein ABIH74_05030 [Candidatus Omnitrophota bacterium]
MSGKMFFQIILLIIIGGLIACAMKVGMKYVKCAYYRASDSKCVCCGQPSKDKGKMAHMGMTRQASKQEVKAAAGQ